MEVLQRPGGELATRPIHFFWVVDCSGSMYGEKIGIVNNTIQECIPKMRSAADNGLIRSLGLTIVLEKDLIYGKMRNGMLKMKTMKKCT